MITIGFRILYRLIPNYALENNENAIKHTGIIKQYSASPTLTYNTTIRQLRTILGLAVALIVDLVYLLRYLMQEGGSQSGATVFIKKQQLTAVLKTCFVWL